MADWAIVIMVSYQERYARAMKLIKVKLPEKPKLAKLRKVEIPKLPTRWVLVFMIALIPVIRLVQLSEIDIEKFRVEAPFLVSIIVIFLACISVWVAVQSLKLTRNVMRPFLALQASEVSPKEVQQKVVFEFHVKNTGSVPANVVTIEMQFFDDAEVIEEDNTSKHYYKGRHETPEGVVIFPGAVYNFEKWIDRSNSIGKKLLEDMMNGEVKLRFRVKYRAQGMDYITVQTEKLKAEAGALTRLPIQPQRWT